MRTSCGLKLFLCRSESLRTRIASIWLEIDSAESSASRGCKGKLTSDTMRISACIARATLMGRFSANPPSTSRRPFDSTGANTPGADMLARMAIARSPLSITTALPVSKSVATARNGVGSKSKSVLLLNGSVSWRSVSCSFCP